MVGFWWSLCEQFVSLNVIERSLVCDPSISEEFIPVSPSHSNTLDRPLHPSKNPPDQLNICSTQRPCRRKEILCTSCEFGHGNDTLVARVPEELLYR